MLGVVMGSSIVSPLAIPLDLLLDTAVIFRQVLLLVQHCAAVWHGRLQVVFHWVFVQAPKKLALSWIDLELYEAMHNTIAAVLQSFLSVVLNSALYALGNKPSHGVFFSNLLFIIAAVASFLAILRSLALTLYLAYRYKTSAVTFACRTMAGNTFNVAGEDSVAPSSSRMELLAQQRPS